MLNTSSVNSTQCARCWVRHLLEYQAITGHGKRTNGVKASLHEWLICLHSVAQQPRHCGMQLRFDATSVCLSDLPCVRSSGGRLHRGVGGGKAGGDVQCEGVHGGVVEGDSR